MLSLSPQTLSIKTSYYFFLTYLNFLLTTMLRHKECFPKESFVQKILSEDDSLKILLHSHKDLMSLMVLAASRVITLVPEKQSIYVFHDNIYIFATSMFRTLYGYKIFTFPPKERYTHLCVFTSWIINFAYIKIDAHYTLSLNSTA